MPRKLSSKRRRPENVDLKPISEIAHSIGIKDRFLELHGPYIAKLSLELLKKKRKKPGKCIIVTSITPTPFGEGKTVTAIGLSMALNRLKKRAISCILQPSLAGLFGMKGAATGGGRSQVFPTEEANFHFTGDSHAVEAAHNICAAHLDNLVFGGNPLDMDIESIAWRRVVDVNDRALRNVNIGLGSKSDGITRKTGFDITASSELMSILALSADLKDLRERVGRIVIGFTKKGKAVTCEGLKIAGIMTAVLKKALNPSLLQTSENTPCLMHTGSYGDLSLGSVSVVADRLALGLAEYVVTETGFGADLGAEKFFDIKCRYSGFKPDAAVIVCTTRALKMHSGDFDVTATKLPREIMRENVSSVERGFSNLEKQIENLQVFGVPVVVCINRFADDSEKEITALKKRALNLGVAGVALSDVWASGSQGGIELAQAVIEACGNKQDFRFLYPLDMPLKDKIRRITKTIYGAKEAVFSETADKKALLFKKQKLDNLPVCIAKTPLSLSTNPKRKGRPHGFKFHVDDLVLNNGAGYITALCSGIKTMPGMPRVPAGLKIDIDDEGRITGLF